MTRRASYLSWLFVLFFATAAQAGVREDFAQALAMAEAPPPMGDLSGANDSAELRGYILSPYLVTARLRAALNQMPNEQLDAVIPQFLAQNPGLPPARELRRQWMNSLAERALWPQFLANYTETSDIGLRCHRLTAWLETGGIETLKAETLALWMTGQQLSQACTRPFEWLQQQGELNAERKEQRARLALEAGNPELADWLLKSSPPERAEPMQRWIRLLRQPKNELRVLASNPELPADWGPLRDAFAKVVRASSYDGLEILPQLLQRPLEEAQRNELRLLQALALSWERKPEALEWFRQVPDAALDNRGHEWRVRAALWAGDWPLVGDWLSRMPPEMAAQPRWSYWRARSLEIAGQREAALPQYRALAQNNGYYALIASWRARIPYQPKTLASGDDRNLLNALIGQPGALRARELLIIGRNEWANSEWNLLTADMSPSELIQAARMAASWGWTLQAAAAWKRAEVVADDLEILYPRPYPQEMRAAAVAAGIPEDWIYAIARQESLFLPQARSRSDALGLLQIKPDTARHIAKRTGRPAPQREDLFLPSVNTQLGAAYLAEVLTRYEGHLALAIGSYNAGPNAVGRWLTEQPVEADVWIENVPFNETRDYIQKVLWNAAYYSSRSSGQPPQVAAWMAPIRKPQPAASPAGAR